MACSEIVEADYISDSSENQSQLNFSLSQQYLSTLSSYDDENVDLLSSFPSSQPPSAPSPSPLSQLLPPLSLSEILFNDFHRYNFLKPFKKYLQKILRFQKIQNYILKTGNGIDQRMARNRFAVNQKVKVNLPRYKEEVAIILQVRKSV
jgi:hypothetical protein